MSAVLVVLLWVLGVGVAFVAVVWLGVRMVTNGGRGAGPTSGFGVLTEIFHPAQHRAEVEIHQQQERRDENGSPDDL